MADAPLTPDDLVLASRAALVRLQAHARIPGNNICEFSKAKPEGMCGWLDDACTHADIVAADLQKLIDSAPQPQPPAAPLTPDPMDMPLPCDVTVGGITIRAGVPLRTLVLRTQCLHDTLRERFGITTHKDAP